MVSPMAEPNWYEVSGMNKNIPLRRYSLRGGVDVNMYNTLLEPDFALNVDAESYTDEEEKAVWDRFDINAYRSKILEIAIPLLTKKIEQVFCFCSGVLIPGCVSIYSPHDYSYAGDELRFSIEAHSELPESEMQALLDSAVSDDWNAEFGSHYRISEQLGERYTIYDFLRPEGGEA